MDVYITFDPLPQSFLRQQHKHGASALHKTIPLSRCRYIKAVCVCGMTTTSKPVRVLQLQRNGCWDSKLFKLKTGELKLAMIEATMRVGVNKCLEPAVLCWH